MAEAQSRPASPWLSEIDKALKREDDWRKRAKKVIQRYRDERDVQSAVSKVNILWSNTEVLRAALYSRTPKPDVRRRFADAAKDNGAARAAAEVIERSVSYGIDTYDIDSAIEPAIDDMLLPGRGTAWVSYEPEIEEIGQAEPPSEEDDEPSEDAEPPEARIVGQKLCTEYVYWEDFTHGLSRTWRDCPWVARRHAMPKTDFEAKFPDATPIKGGFGLATAGDSEGAGDGDFVEIWEVWARKGKERLYVGRGYDNILQADPDPLGLENFFPCPEPLYSVMTTDTRVPNPEFLQYQDQASELDVVSTRITRLVEQMRWRGVYDATADTDGSTLKALENAEDGTLLPHENFQALRDKGGIDGALGFIPIERIYPIVAQLQQQRAALVQDIYQVTGISDIIRGSTDPHETKGAQVLKAQFGSMRMQKRQQKVQRFIRDLYRLQAEIIAEHFTQETLAEITGMDLPTAEEQQALKAQQAMAQMPSMMGHNGGPPMAPMPAPAPMDMSAGLMAGGAPPDMGMPPSDSPPVAPGAMTGAATPSPQPAVSSPMPPAASPEDMVKVNGPTWEQVIDILRSDKLRGYRVDIETDSTMAVDAEAEKAARLEFVGAMEKALAGAYQAMQVAPKMLPLIKEITLFTMRSFKPGKALEEGVETAFDELAKNPIAEKGPPPDPNAWRIEAEKGRLALDTEKAKAEAALKMQDGQAAAKKAETDAQIKMAELALKREDMQQSHALDMAKVQSANALGAAKLNHEMGKVDPVTPEKGPSESIAYKDIPPEAQAQMLAQAGIIIHPQALADHAAEQAAQAAAAKAKPPAQ